MLICIFWICLHGTLTHTIACCYYAGNIALYNHVTIAYIPKYLLALIYCMCWEFEDKLLDDCNDILPSHTWAVGSTSNDSVRLSFDYFRRISFSRSFQSSSSTLSGVPPFVSRTSCQSAWWMGNTGEHFTWSWIPCQSVASGRLSPGRLSPRIIHVTPWNVCSGWSCQAVGLL